MNKKFRITLLVAMFSLFIIGFGGTATAEAAGNCLGTASTNMTAEDLVNCRSDSAYQAANPELMVSHRFVVADVSAASRPASSDSAYQAANPELAELDRNYGTFAGLWTGIIDREVAADPDRAALDRNYGTFAGLWTNFEASQPVSVDIEVRNHNYYDNLWTARHGDSPATQTDLTAKPVDNISFLLLPPNYSQPGR